MSERDLLAFTDGYHEDRDGAGTPRPGYAAALSAVAGTDLAGLCRAVADELQRRGVSFGGEPFVVDPVPRLIAAAEWDPLAAGLAQRGRALNRFVLDAYGERQIVQAGVIPAEVIDEAKGYEPDLVGCLPQHAFPAAIIGFDVVRDRDGAFLVLEDNMRTPSGFAYALAAREALAGALPPGLPEPRPVDPLAFDLLGGALRAAAPPERRGDPAVVLLTDGPGNVAYYEHAQAARRVGATLATADDLVRDGDRLRIRLPDGGGARPVDVVYRRTNEDRVRDDHGELTAVAQLLLAPWLLGEIGLVNAFGTGLADDKFTHIHVEDFVRFYLGEEPLVRSVPTSTISTERAPTIKELRRLVVKPRHGSGGVGVVIGAHADREDLERLVRELQAYPHRYIAQPIVALSRHPTVVDGRLEPRHVDLRAFAFAGDDVEVPPGGLTRVALNAGALVVNSSQMGGGKDTWVVD